MIIETYDESKTKVISVTWKFKNSDQEYWTSFDTCNNPFCGCAVLTFRIGIIENTPSIASFSFDVIKKKAKKIDADVANKLLSAKLISELSKEDYAILSSIFHSKKVDIINECNLEEIVPPPFPVKEIEETSLLIEFKSIFPWAQDLFFSIDNTTYFIVEQYCVNSLCQCKDVAINFLEIRNNIQINQNDYSVISFNYQNGKWEITEQSKKKHPCSVLVKGMITKYPDIRNILINRKAKLQLLYKRYKEQNGFKDLMIKPEQTPTAGRNEPCPCGSGKKFKKCCGK